MTVPVLARNWVCANDCGSWARTVDAKTPMHRCRSKGLAGLLVPLVVVGTSCKVEAIEREDMIGDEHVQTDADGRPVMSVVTTRDDGQDCTVYAPVAVATREELCL